MEVFMRGLPDQNLSDRSLEDLLLPFMTSIGVPKHAFHCEKNPRKRFAHLTFGDRADGERFLSIYGEIDPATGKPPVVAHDGQPSINAAPAPATPRTRNSQPQRQSPRTWARLRILGAPVWCTESDRPVDPIAVRAVRDAAGEAKAARKDTAKENADPPLSFHVGKISCGHYAYVQRDLVFFPEQEWLRDGVATFSRLNLTVDLAGGVKIRIPLNSIQEIVWSPNDSGRLTLTLSNAPYFMTAVPNIEDFMAILNLQDSRDRPREELNRMTALDSEHAKIVGTCLIYQLHLEGQHHRLQQKISSLMHRNFTSVSRYELPTRTRHPTLGDFKQQLIGLKEDLSASYSRRTLPFGVLFVLQALLYNAYLHPGLIRDMLRELARRYKADKLAGRRPICVEAVKSLMEDQGWPSPFGDPSLFELGAIMEWITTRYEEIQSSLEMRSGGLQNPNLAQIYRAVVTPTRILLHGPDAESSESNNRVLRKHSKHQDRFLRVQFCEEDGGDLRFDKVAYARVYARFKDVLLRGIQLPGRVYSFLGFSHSSLRAHSVWFCAPFVDEYGSHSYHSIIEALGRFDHIQCPAKFAARIGQAFSETPSVVPLSSYDNIEIKLIPDIWNADKTRIFSDGVGKVSRDMMHIIWSHISIKKSAPTCFQIRYAGCKGMLALDTRLEGRTICFRESMKKFESEDQYHLEICDSGSKPIPLFLNRQMIKILEDMGVDREWFKKIQGYRLHELQCVTASAYNVQNFLDAQNVGQVISLGKFIYFADRHGLDYAKDPFLRAVVEVVVLRELRLLKHRARIPVTKGKTLFGVMDETGLLREGEVYVTFAASEEAGFQKPPAHGQLVIITRSPALHPGDIQTCIQHCPPPGDPKHPLAELENCVVFSRRGSRDLPSQLGGGDLDGDIYNVIWDEEATPKKTFKPAEYKIVPPHDIGRKVTREDIVDHFIDFMKNDKLGLIAKRHLILADQKEEGTLNEDCLKLAELHSKAVDFSKTGIPVDVKELPRLPNQYRPDFLSPGPIAHLHDKGDILLEQYTVPDGDEEVEHGEPPRYKYYKSDKILGELYRAVDEEKIWHQEVRARASKGGSSFWTSFLALAFDRAAAVGATSWPVRIDEARLIKSSYDDAIQGHMAKFSDHPINCISELEVFTGYIHNKTGTQTPRQRDSSHKLRDAFDRTAAYFTRLMRQGSPSLGLNLDDDDDEPAPLTGYMQDLGPSAALDLCLACVCFSSLHDCPQVAQRLGRPAEPRSGRGGRCRRDGDGDGGLQSFRVVAATAFLKELKIKELSLSIGDGGGTGGGFVGVSAYA